MPRAAPRLAAMDAMDAEGGTALTAPQLLSDACNHCVVVVDTTGELGGFWAMDAEGGTALTAVKNNPHSLRSASETPQEGPRDCQCRAAARARNT